MKKVLIVVGAAAGVALLARSAARHCGGIDFEQMIERMPENAPPKWVFQNISAIRANTDRMLELLDHESTATTEAREPVAAA